MATQTVKSLTTKQRELVRTDEDVRYEISKEIGNIKVQTVYTWALRFPEKLANSKAAMRVIEKYCKA